MKIPRNAPCPCGSGKKYKKCCLIGGGDKAGSSPAQEMMDAFNDHVGEREFSSIEELQAELDGFTYQRNSAPLVSFHGLSPHDMHRFLHFPFASPDLVYFADDFAVPPEVPVLRLFTLLIEAVGEKGLKPTAKGNLPQRFCREAALAFWGEDKYAERTRFGSIRSEMDFFDMHCLRLVAGMAGLVRKYKGKFVVTGKCRKKIAAQGLGAVYFDLFKVYVTKFNWAYRYGYQEIPFIQQAFAFSLFLLHKYGAKSRPQEFYEDIFLQAFPEIIGDIDPVSYQSVEENFRNAFFHRTMYDFAGLFGLVELRNVSVEKFSSCYEVKKTPLLDQFVCFTDR